MKQQFLGAVAAAVVLSAVPAAQAAPMLAFQLDAGPILFCADNDAGCDDNPLAGAITYNNPIAPFTVFVSTGVSKAVVSGNPLLALNTIDITGGPGQHDLIVAFSDNGFTAQGNFSLAFAGTLNGAGATAEATAYQSTTNLLFAQTTAIGTLGPFSAAAFADTLSDGLAPSAPYSVSQFLTLTTSATEATTLTAGFVVNLPEPATLTLLALGLLAFGFGSRRHAV